MKLDRAIFTIATGKPMYLEMAYALARSFKLWHRESDIRFYLATDAARESLPQDLRDMKIIPLGPGQFGKGFSPKLHLDKIAPAQCSMFVDADCLCVGSLEKAFEVFCGHPISVIGREITGGEWSGDVASICQRFGVPGLLRFNGGVYYLEKGEICSRVYETARELEPQYDEIGFVRLRNCENEEPLVSLAMVLHNQKPVEERGDIMNSLLAGPGGLEIDVFKGHARLKNPKSHPKHNSWYQQEEMRPMLVHFLGTEITTYPYGQETIRLRLVCEKHWPVRAATFWTKVAFSWPWILKQKLKTWFRPVYRAIFGLRKVKSTRSFSEV